VDVVERPPGRLVRRDGDDVGVRVRQQKPHEFAAHVPGGADDGNLR
jgi:hypothetical protein